MPYYVGLDLGGTNIKAGLVDSRAKVLAQVEVPTYAGRGADAVVERVVEISHQVARKAQVPWSSVAGLGVGMPGPTDSEQGIVINAVNLGNWQNYPLRQRLEFLTGLPTVIDNDANVATYGEYWGGSGCDLRIRHLVMLTVGTGIGGGVVVGGQLLRGNQNLAAELGHMLVVPHGELCNCGQRGCLEAYTSAHHLVRRAQQLISRTDQPTRLAGLGPHNPLTCKAIFDAAAEGDPLALGVVDEMADYLGQACVSLCRIFAPQMIVFGGGVAAAGDFLLERIRQAFLKATWRLLPEKVQIVPAMLGNTAGLIGAAGLAATASEVDQVAPIPVPRMHAAS